MKFLRNAFVLLFCSFALLSFSACFKKKDSSVRQVDAQEARGLVANGFAVLVDVRENEERKDGSVENSEWLAFSKFQSDPSGLEVFLKNQSKEKEILFYCASGKRAEILARAAASHGWKSGYLTDTTGLPFKK